jgi:hypothetical protein
MRKKFFATLLVGLLTLVYAPKIFGDDGQNSIRHVLLLSIDGMHALDYYNCVHGIGGTAPYCPNLAALGLTGVNYTEASTSKPSDSYPGILALVSGASPRTAGAYYDVSYARELAPPPGGAPCVIGTPGPGTVVGYDEGLDVNINLLSGGGIDPSKLPLDPMNGCKPIYPHSYVRVNTIFGVAHSHGRYTAWSDKNPGYEIVKGHTPVGAPNNNIDDFNSPEVHSVVQGVPNVAGYPACTSVRDSSETSVWTNSFQNIQCYDLQKVQILLNEIDGKKSDGSGPAKVPAIFGMDYQAWSVGQKLVDFHTPAVTGGYLNPGPPDSDPFGPLGKPSAPLLNEITFVDNTIGTLVSELKAKGLYESTMIIICAKHGQSPIDISRFFEVPSAPGRPSKLLSALVAGSSEDDVSLLWLNHSSDTITAVSMLEANEGAAGIGEIYAGPSMLPLFGDPTVDPRVPDIVVTPNVGVFYTGSGSKIADHGGFLHDDTNVVLLFSNPHMQPKTVTSPVENAQVAPTILKILGLDPNELKGVQLEHTQVLPGVPFHD